MASVGWPPRERLFAKRCAEEEPLQAWQTTALEGGSLVAKQLRQAVEQKINRPVSDEYLWDLLKRHGWRKKAPRPEHTYVFSAVCPLQGETYSLISPLCNTEDMNGLSHGLSTAYDGEEILLFADSAGWHKSKELQLPANIHLELLPPYSPELNPTEHLSDYIREQKGFNHHAFDSLDELENHLEEVLENRNQEKDYIRSRRSFHWIASP